MSPGRTRRPADEGPGARVTATPPLVRRLFVCNPHARAAPGCEALAPHLGAGDACVTTARAEDVPTCVARAVDEGFDAVVAVGGDSTVSQVATALLGFPGAPALGIVPAGTGNDLARTLGLALEPAEALAGLEDAVARWVDVLVAEPEGAPRRVGLNAAIGGPSAERNEAIDPETKRRWGPLAFVAAAVDALQELRRVRTRVIWEDADEDVLELVGATVSNGRTAGGGVVLAPEARLDDGRLDVSVVQAGSVGAYVGLAAALLAGRLAEHPLTLHRRVRSVRFEPETALPFNLDGDLLCSGAVRFSVAPGALRLWGPLRP